MKSNGLRAWRRWCKRARLRMNPHHRSLYRAAIMRKKQPERRPLPPKQFTARSLVGMTMGARKRKARYWMECEHLHQKAQDFQEVVDRSVGRKSSLRTIGHTPISLRNHYRIGERLRPCPGCPQCTDDPLRIVRALSRRMKLRVEIRRCNSAIIPGKFDYLAMLHRPGPAWNPVCGFGPMRQDAVRALCDVILREGAEEFPIVSCDGSGVLPARKQR